MLEGLRAEFGRQEWQDTTGEVMAELTGPEYGAGGPPQQIRDDSLASLAEMGLTVREVS